MKSPLASNGLMNLLKHWEFISLTINTCLRKKNFIEKTLKNLQTFDRGGIYLYMVNYNNHIIFYSKKFVFICSMLPTPKEVVKQLNQMIFKFLWNGTDKVSRVLTINEYSEGGLKMIDLECMVKSLRLAWLERIFNHNDGIWKRYLGHKLQPFGGLFFMNCNYDKETTTNNNILLFDNKSLFPWLRR